MLKAVGAASLDQLIDEVIPASIRLPKPLSLPAAESESHYLARLDGSRGEPWPPPFCVHVGDHRGCLTGHGV